MIPSSPRALAPVSALAIALGGVLLGSCHKPPPPAASVAAESARPLSASAAPSSPPGAAVSSAPRVTAAPSASASGSAPVALDPEARERAARYVSGLSRGRVATRKGNFPAAIAAFDDALGVQPADARALAERGFAELQAKDLVAARRDLLAARDRAPSSDLLSQITTNLGLVARAGGDEAGASALLDQAAALRKARRGSNCPVIVERGSALTPPSVTLYPSVRAARDALARRLTKEGVKLTSPLPTEVDEAALRKVWLGEDPGPWHLALEGDYHTEHHLLLPQSDRSVLLVENAAVADFTRCGGVESVVFDPGPFPSFTVTETTADVGYMCNENHDTETRPCTEIKYPDAHPVQSFCAEPSHIIRTDIFDPKTGILRVRIEEHGDGYESTPLVQIVKQSGAALVSGAGCDLRVPYEK